MVMDIISYQYMHNLVKSRGNLLKSVVGPGGPARGTLVSTVPTVAPGPAMGTLESMDAGEASWAQRSLPGPRHVARNGCARLLGHNGANGRSGGARHDRGRKAARGAGTRHSAAQLLQSPSPS